jgi:hypothetical protein
MPTAQTLERFIALGEGNAHVEAVEGFYTADASMQENQSAPRVGRDAHVANERRVLAKTKTLTSKCVRPVFVSGDNVVIRAAYSDSSGSTERLPARRSLAYQRWAERIAEETFFFYDPHRRTEKAARLF